MAQRSGFSLGTLKQRICLAILVSTAVIFLALYGRDGISSVYTSPFRTYHDNPTSNNIITTPNPDPTATDLSLPTAPFLTHPLSRICAETIFVPGLVFLCDNNSGGPGNIRNYILTCLRYAIAAGATSLALPRIRTRSDSDLSNIHLGHREFDYLFDSAHFRAGLAAACPQIAVYDELTLVPHVLDKLEREAVVLGGDVEKMIERITPRTEFAGMRGGCDQRDLNRYTDQFGDRFRSWLNSSVEDRGAAQISVDEPRVFRLNWGVLWDWEVWRDGPEFVATFGGLLRFNEELLQLGQIIAETLRQEARAVQGDGSEGKVLGVHLRTEADALKEWPSFQMQVDGYMEEIDKRELRGAVAYLASGSEAEAHKFRDLAHNITQIKVRTKFDILEGENLERLRSLTWDQQAVVDFVVLLIADYFLGVSPSSFSINVALKRHLRSEGLFTRPWKVEGPGDGRSHIVGSYDRYWDDWLFMYDGMWP